MDDMLAVEGHLAATEHDTRSTPASDAVSTETACQGMSEAFQSEKKSSTWKRLKKMVKHPKAHEIVFGDNTLAAAEPGPSSPGGASVTATNVADDAASEVMSEAPHGHHQRFAGMLGHSRGAGTWDDCSVSERSTRGGTLKGLFDLHGKKSSKRVDPLQLDALRIEIGMLQERLGDAERDLACRKGEIESLLQERGALAVQVQELSCNLTAAGADLAAAQSEAQRLRQLHSQVKEALQEAYTSQAQQKQQLRDLEELCGAQQNSLEEGEERFRCLQQEQDSLRHSSLAAKAQLVTAQAQLAEARAQREELLTELAGLTNTASTLQAELDGRDEKMNGLEEAAEQANSGLEHALTRLQELEGEKQQLEGRLGLMHDENRQLADELSCEAAERRQLEESLADSRTCCSGLQSQLDVANGNVELLSGRLRGLLAQLEGSSSLRSQNAELQRELASIREEQQQKRPGSPLSKWCRAQHKASPSATATGAAAATTTSPGSAAAAASHCAEAGGSGPGAAGGAGFSPMTSQLPAAVVQRQQQQHQLGVMGAPPSAPPAPSVALLLGSGAIEDDTHGCVMIHPGAAQQAEACCTVTAATVDSAGSDKLAGPLTACRPASSRRPASSSNSGKHLQQQQQQVAGAEAGGGSSSAAAAAGAMHSLHPFRVVAGGGSGSGNAGRAGSSSSGGGGGGAVAASHPLLARLFGCFGPATAGRVERVH